jgi:hypothetical protein
MTGWRPGSTPASSRWSEVADPLVRASWAGTVAFTLSAVVAVAVAAARPVAAVVAVALFVAGTVAFLVALVRAAGRSRTETLSVAGIFFLQGSAPPDVRRQLLASLAVEVGAAFTAAGLRPYTSLAFGILVPVYGLGLAGLWGATRGAYAPRG